MLAHVSLGFMKSVIPSINIVLRVESFLSYPGNLS